MPLIGARGTASRGYFGGGTKPGAPVITSSTQGVSSLSIAFDAPIFNGGLLITRYEQAFSIDNSTWSPWALASSSTSPPTSPVTISGLTNGQAYYVKIRAVNGLGAGAESNVWSTTTTPRTTPNAPTLNSVTRGYRQLTLAFTAPAFNGGSAITNYEFSTNNGTTWTSMGQSGTSNYTITGLSDFTSYDVRIRAVNVAGSGAQSNMITGVTAGVTNAPIGLSAGSNGVFQAVLTWTAPDSNASPISDYVVQYSTSSTFASSVTTFSDGVSATTGATVTSLAASTTYYFRVAAVNQVGQGGWSSIVPATTASVPSQAGTPTSSAGDKSFTIFWSAPANGGSSITGYSVQYSSDGGSSWSLAETFSSPSTEFTNRSKTWNSLSNGTSYIGRVLAINAVGSGSYSGASTARTPGYGAPEVVSISSSANESTPYVRTVSMTVNPPDALDYDRTDVWIARNGQNYEYAGNIGRKASFGSGLGTGNQSLSFTSAYYNDGTYAFEADLSYDEVIKYRVITYNTSGYSTETNGTHSVLGRQQRTPAAYNDWVYSGSYQGTTGVFDVNGQNFLQTSAYSIPGISNSTTPSVGNQRYRVTSLTIQAWTASGNNTSTSLRWFTVGWSGTTTSTFSQTFDSYPSTNFTAGSGGTEASPGATQTWNITNVDYGAGAGAGKIRVDGRSGTTGNTATHPWSPIIYVKVKINGDYQTYTTIQPATIYW